MTTLCYYNFNSKNASNNIENVIFRVYDLSLNGTLTNISISSTYTKFEFPSLYRSVSDSASRSYYYNALSLLNTSFSIAFWLRTTGESNAECALRLDNGTNYILFYLSNGSANSNFIQIQVPGDNTWYGMFLKTTGLSAGKIWNTNDWNHIALIASYNGTTTSINVYYNGSLVNYEFATVGGGLNTSTNKVTPPANATDSVKVTGQVFSSVPTLYILGSPINNGLACYVSNIYLINYAISTTELNNIINNVYIPKFNSYLRGKFDNTYAVTSQVLSAQTYSPNCVSSDGKNLISLQGTYPNFTIYYSTNYGANWALSNAPVTIYSPTCSPVNFPNVFYVGAINGSFKLYRSADGGATWTLISTQFGNISGLCVNDADTILYLSNYQNAMYYSTRAGNASFNYATNTGTFTFTQITNSNNSFQYTSCVCSPDGTFLFGTASGSNCAFKYNFNNTSSFNASLLLSYNTNIGVVAMSSTGSHLYASLFSNASNSLLRSTDGGATFNAIGTGVIPNNSNFGISCDTTGQYVQATTSQYWYISSNYGTTFTAYTGSLPSPPSIYNNNQFVLQLSNTNVNYITPPPPYPCFLQGSKILRLNPETDEESYVPVETLREGDLIRTHQNGYKAIFHIGRKTLDRPSDDPNPRNRLYRFPKSKIPGMREDLCITGEHCTLHNDLSPELKDKVNEHMGDIYITEYMYRVPACLDERAVPYKGDGPVTIWHFALENHNIYYNYGVYANGLLVESCSIQYLTELANMELVYDISGEKNEW